jgi:DNA segregation ATPase FtsK/SpoIIIE, S-DNA-T family
MATRTSSPPASRSRSTSRKGGSSSRSRSSGTSTSKRKPAQKSAQKPARKRSQARRPAPRAVRNGPGPVSRTFGALGRGASGVWLGVAGGVGAGARRIGQGARDLEPEHRRDGAGLFLIAVALVVAASVWWQVPGSVFAGTRAVVAGSVGLLAWFVPLMLCYVAWRNLRDPDANGPAGRQVVGWAALLFGVLGIIHIANGSPKPELGDTSELQQAGGALGFVVAKLLTDLLHTGYVVVPLLVLLALFGVLVVTATPVYQVPARLRHVRDRLLGRHVEDEPVEDTTAIKRRRRRALDDVDP